MAEQAHFGARQVARLNDPGRIRELRPKQLLTEVAGVLPGMTCVDMGSGTGVFALPMAGIVGEQGKVYAVDRSPDMVRYISLQTPGPQLEPLQADVSNTGLSGGAADMCLAAFVIHELAAPSALVAEAYRLLKPSGLFVVVEWRMDATIGPPRDVRISQRAARSLLSEAGFFFVSYCDWSINHYVVTAKKPLTEVPGPSLQK